jgi:hypothetical protein
LGAGGVADVAQELAEGEIAGGRGGDAAGLFGQAFLFGLCGFLLEARGLRGLLLCQTGAFGFGFCLGGFLCKALLFGGGGLCGLAGGLGGGLFLCDPLLLGLLGGKSLAFGLGGQSLTFGFRRGGGSLGFDPEAFGLGLRRAALLFEALFLQPCGLKALEFEPFLFETLLFQPLLFQPLRLGQTFLFQPFLFEAQALGFFGRETGGFLGGQAFFFGDT